MDEDTNIETLGGPAGKANENISVDCCCMCSGGSGENCIHDNGSIMASLNAYHVHTRA